MTRRETACATEITEFHKAVLLAVVVDIFAFGYGVLTMISFFTVVVSF